MSKINVFVSNQSEKTVQYHYKSSQGVLSANDTKKISISVGDTFNFENDNGTKYLIDNTMDGETIYYSKQN